MGKEKQGAGKMTDKEIQASDEEMEQFNVLQNEKCVSVKTEKLNDLKNRISFALKDATLQQGFEIICKRIALLEKENEELKEKLNVRSCQNCKHNNKSCSNDGSCVHYSKWEDYKNLQLTKAKDLLLKLSTCLEGHSNNNFEYELIKQAEQFLNCEVEE